MRYLVHRNHSPTVVAHIAMANRQSHVNHDILAIGMVDDAGEHFP